MSALLDALLTPGHLSFRFQPVFEFTGEARALHSLECLARGPQTGNFARADVLFDFVRLKHAESRMDRRCTADALAAGARLPGAPPLSLNVHAVTLATDREFPEFLAQAAASAGVAAARLTVEIIEHCPAWELPALSAARERLRVMGMRVALDDVGRAEANFQMIIECRPDVLKIDRLFVTGVHADPLRRAVVDSILTLATALGAEVVAEGIEAPEDFAALRASGIRLYQGYLFARPMSGEALVEAGILPAAEAASLPTAANY